jgi:hypothetical protein
MFSFFFITKLILIVNKKNKALSVKSIVLLYFRLVHISQIEEASYERQFSMLFARHHLFIQSKFTVRS